MRYDPESERFLDSLLLELRAAQDKEIDPHDAGTIDPLMWAAGAVRELARARHARETSDAFRRRVLRATAYLLGSLESFDRRKESDPTNSPIQEVRHERV